MSISKQSAAVMADIHAKGIVHRDLKPENVFLCPDAEMEALTQVIEGMAQRVGLRLSPRGSSGSPRPSAPVRVRPTVSVAIHSTPDPRA